MVIDVTAAAMRICDDVITQYVTPHCTMPNKFCENQSQAEL
jgi:hypothetical protein